MNNHIYLLIIMIIHTYAYKTKKKDVYYLPYLYNINIKHTVLIFFFIPSFFYASLRHHFFTYQIFTSKNFHLKWEKHPLEAPKIG